MKIKHGNTCRVATTRPTQKVLWKGAGEVSVALENALVDCGALGTGGLTSFPCITKNQTIKGFKEPLYVPGPNDIKCVVHCSSRGVSILSVSLVRKQNHRKTKQRLDQAITKQGFNQHLLITMALLRSHVPRPGCLVLGNQQ